jgi:ATP-binding cassette subfamily C protein LapB
VTGAPGTTAGDETAVLWFSLASHVQSENLSDSENPAMRLVWRELLRDRRWVFRVAAATLLVNILAIPTSLFAMQVYDRVVPTLAWATLTTLVAGMGLVVGLDWLLKTLRAHIMDSVASSVDKRLSQHVYEHLLHLQLDQQPGSLGTLAAQVGALDSVRQVFSAGLVFGIVDLPFALLFIGIIGLIGGQSAGFTWECSPSRWRWVCIPVCAYAVSRANRCCAAMSVWGC